MSGGVTIALILILLGIGLLFLIGGGFFLYYLFNNDDNSSNNNGGNGGNGDNGNGDNGNGGVEKVCKFKSYNTNEFNNAFGTLSDVELALVKVKKPAEGKCNLCEKTISQIPNLTESDYTSDYTSDNVNGIRKNAVGWVINNTTSATYNFIAQFYDSDADDLFNANGSPYANILYVSGGQANKVVGWTELGDGKTTFQNNTEGYKVLYTNQAFFLEVFDKEASNRVITKDSKGQCLIVPPTFKQDNSTNLLRIDITRNPNNNKIEIMTSTCPGTTM